jgi:hypothetical protein
MLGYLSFMTAAGIIGWIYGGHFANGVERLDHFGYREALLYVVQILSNKLVDVLESTVRGYKFLRK